MYAGRPMIEACREWRLALKQHHQRVGLRIGRELNSKFPKTERITQLSL